MKARHIFLMSIVIAVIGGIALLCGRASSYAGENSAGRDRSAPAASASVEPATATIAKGLVALRVELRSKTGPNGKVATPWDGRLQVSRGRLHDLRLWQDNPNDRVNGETWVLSTGHENRFNVQARRRGHETAAAKDGALLVELVATVPETELSFETQQGNFSFALKEIEWGAPKPFLKGLAQVARVASSATILSAPTEDDYPAAARGRDGRLYVAYLAFTHGKDFRARPPLAEPPKDYSFLAEPTGGDQLLLLRLDGDTWTGPMAVTSPGQDLFRPAITIDGSGGVWVFWSANRDGNWDLFARRLTGETWSPEIRLTTDPGADIFPAATTDKSGKAWVAWQAFRNGQSDILAVRQDGDGFGSPMVVTDAAGDQWTPAVAVSSDGQVAVAWDSYEKGNYDVFCRVWTAGQFGEVIGIAQTLKAETRPSIVYDSQGRLWIAYEEGPEKWGKDWGALEKAGVALYQERTVAVRVWSEAGLLRPVDDPANAFAPGRRRAERAALPPAGPQAKEDANQVLTKAINANAGPRQKLALPRLTTGADGRIWLAVRTPRLGDRAAVGTAWFEHLAWYEGNQWSGEIVCPRTDNLLDNRPALVPLPDGGLLLVASSDERFEAQRRRPSNPRQAKAAGQTVEDRSIRSPWPDQVNNELVMAQLGPVAAGAAKTAVLEAVPAADAPAAADPMAAKEAADVARMRAARATIGGKTLLLRRGEFHRHTEISPDGGGDGLLMDMWRYAIDMSSLDWVGNGDHDNGNGREYSWWLIQQSTDVFNIAGVFTPMFTYERSCAYPDGHRNPVFAKRGIRTLPRLQGGRGEDLDKEGPDAPRPHSPDTQMLYAYLAHFDGVCASHTSGTNMGTDWRDNDPRVEPVVEIYQGCRQNYEMPGAPRSNTAENSIGGWRPFGFVSLALKKGYRLGFQSSSDHISTHISYCNVWAEEPTREAILAAMKARHVYGATDNIIADVRCGEHFMGEEFTVTTKPRLTIHLTGTGPLAKVNVIKDGNYVHIAEPNQQEVKIEWTDFDPAPGKTSYYYVRGEQADGELVWVSPMWIKYQP